MPLLRFWYQMNGRKKQEERKETRRRTSHVLGMVRTYSRWEESAARGVWKVQSEHGSEPGLVR